LIPDPDFYPSRTPDPNPATESEVKKNLLSQLICSHKLHKNENYFKKAPDPGSGTMVVNMDFELLSGRTTFIFPFRSH
jgi:hypothetical protein